MIQFIIDVSFIVTVLVLSLVTIIQMKRAKEYKRIKEEVRKAIGKYSAYTGFLREGTIGYSRNIYDIKVSKNKGTWVVTLYTNAPGIVIGKGGSAVKGVASELQRNVFNDKGIVQVDVQECQLWKEIY
jgi:ribosomal protein S3